MPYLGPNSIFILDSLRQLHYATRQNFSAFVSPNVTKEIAKNRNIIGIMGRLEKIRFVRRIPSKTQRFTQDGKERTTIFEQFYCLTSSGLKAIGYDKAHSVEPRAISRIAHEYAKINFMLGVMWHYRKDWEINVSFPELGDFRPDVQFKMENYGNSEKRSFLVEIEISREPEKVITEKIKKIEALDFKKIGLSDKTQIIFAYSNNFNTSNNFFLPIDYQKEWVKFRINKSLSKFKSLLGRANALTLKKNYLFTHLPDYHKTNEKVFYRANGEQVKLI